MFKRYRLFEERYIPLALILMYSTTKDTQ